MIISRIFTVVKLKLYAVRYEEYLLNEYDRIFDNWNDIEYLTNFFNDNIADLQQEIFNYTSVREAVNLTIKEAEEFEELLLDETEKIIFKPLSNSEIYCYYDTERIKGKLNKTCWLRIYAIKVKDNVFVISGGAIKLTKNMQGRRHTEIELLKLAAVKQFLIKNNYLAKDDFA